MFGEPETRHRVSRRCTTGTVWRINNNNTYYWWWDCMRWQTERERARAKSRGYRAVATCQLKRDPNGEGVIWLAIGAKSGKLMRFRERLNHRPVGPRYVYPETEGVILDLTTYVPGIFRRNGGGSILHVDLPQSNTEFLAVAACAALRGAGGLLLLHGRKREEVKMKLKRSSHACMHACMHKSYKG